MRWGTLSLGMPETHSYLTKGDIKYRCNSIKNVPTITVGAEPAERLGGSCESSKNQGPPVPPVKLPQNQEPESDSESRKSTIMSS